MKQVFNAMLWAALGATAIQGYHDHRVTVYCDISSFDVHQAYDSGIDISVYCYGDADR